MYNFIIALWIKLEKGIQVEMNKEYKLYRTQGWIALDMSVLSLFKHVEIQRWQVMVLALFS